jgi:6,7-dimethyl-8-ribityllumazine synthase
MHIANRGDLDASAPQLDGKKLYIGIVQARFNADITDSLVQACRTELIALGVHEKHIDLIQVPGALEIPVALAAMAKSNTYDALVAIGCVIRGETYHFEVVSNEACAGITRVGLDYTLPIANAVLTVETTEQAQERQVINGTAAARVAVEMANLVNEIS